MPESTTLHEPAEKLKTETIDIHRAMVSLMEELEAIDWYRQRSEALHGFAATRDFGAQYERRNRTRFHGARMDSPQCP